MPMNKFLIAPVDNSVETNMKPFMISDGAYELLQNAYAFRGSIRKRFGSYLMNTTVAAKMQPYHSRLRLKVGTTDILGNIAGATVPGIIYKVGQQFLIGEEIFTVVIVGLQIMLTTGGAAVHTYDTATGAFVITGADAMTDCYFYPAEPVMGFYSFNDGNINNSPIIAFDTQFAYEYVAGAWERLQVETNVGDSIWTGNNSQFFWSRMYRGSTPDIRIMYTTNYNSADGIRYFDGTTWTKLTPKYILAATNDIIAARVIIQFAGRLLFLNTIETVGGVNTIYANRCRFSQFGSALQVDAWRQDIPGKGNWIDVPSSDVIVTAEVIKNRVIVYCEKSTWELVYTGNQVQPFLWQPINIELGAESTFSAIPFDKNIVAVGNVGIHKCNGAYVERIDDKIPDTVFQMHNKSDGVKRVYGIRDYDNELIYWTYPSIDSGTVFPNRTLIYNYKNDTWAYNTDSITAFGYYQNQNDITWETMPGEWQDNTGAWRDAAYQAQYNSIVAGNQEGFVYIIDTDQSKNAPSLQISNITSPAGIVTLYIRDHNLTTGDYIYIEHAQGQEDLNGLIRRVLVVDGNTVTLPVTEINADVYTGGGFATRVDNIYILTKQYNFFMNSGQNVYVSKVDFNVDKTPYGEITVDSSPSSSQEGTALAGAATGALLGNNILETRAYVDVIFERTQSRLWHSVYFQTEGNCVQLDFYMTDAQMKNVNIAFADFQLNAMMFHAMATQELF